MDSIPANCTPLNAGGVVELECTEKTEMIACVNEVFKSAPKTSWDLFSLHFLLSSGTHAR